MSKPSEARSTVLDPSILAMLVDVGGTEFAAEVSAIFLKGGPASLEAIRTSFEARDMAALRRALHVLAGGASQIGAPDLAELARRAERAAEDPASDALILSDLVGAIPKAFAHASEELAAWRAELPS